MTDSLHSLLCDLAKEEGFPLGAGVDIDLASESIRDHIGRYDRWLENGFSGAMEYLVRGRDRRADPRLILPDARSVFCVGLPYSRKPNGALDIADGPRYARYLKFQDYHEVMIERLERVMTRAARISGVPMKWKVCVDHSAVLERSWAMLAGLGWIGKNTLLIHPKLGSYFFLGTILISEKLERFPSPLPNYCGGCTRCLDACPTKAIVERGVVNANRCISYWTLEKRGELSITDQDRMAMGPWVAGCDICQEVCPFNIKPSREVEAPSPSGATELKAWMALLDESEEKYRERVKHSSLSRVKPAQFRRNLAITLSNAAGATTLPDEILRILREKVTDKLEHETDPVAKTEWSHCLRVLQSAEVRFRSCRQT